MRRSRSDKSGGEWKTSTGGETVDRDGRERGTWNGRRMMRGEKMVNGSRDDDGRRKADGGEVEGKEKEKFSVKKICEA